MSRKPGATPLGLAVSLEVYARQECDLLLSIVREQVLR